MRKLVASVVLAVVAVTAAAGAAEAKDITWGGRSAPQAPR